MSSKNLAAFNCKNKLALNKQKSIHHGFDDTKSTRSNKIGRKGKGQKSMKSMKTSQSNFYSTIASQPFTEVMSRQASLRIDDPKVRVYGKPPLAPILVRMEYETDPKELEADLVNFEQMNFEGGEDFDIRTVLYKGVLEESSQ
jgi:hypothetical protein